MHADIYAITMLQTLLMRSTKANLKRLKGAQYTIGHQCYNVILYTYFMYRFRFYLAMAVAFSCDIMIGSLYSSSAVFKQCMKVPQAKINGEICSR